MNFLISNDDGVTSPGIQALADAALERGHHVVISAPSGQCSAMSECLTLTRPLIVRRVPCEGKKEVFAVDGTPADCVRLAPGLTDNNHFDFCMTGVNNGENVSSGIFYSGTVSSAREAAMMYIPALAVSLAAGGTREGLKAIADYAVRTAEKLAGKAFPRYGILNINAPKGPVNTWKGPVVCPVSTAYFIDRYTKRYSPSGQMYFWLGEEGTEDKIFMERHQPGTDAALLEDGHITLTLLGGIDCPNHALDISADELCTLHP